MSVEIELKFRVAPRKLRSLAQGEIPGSRLSEREESELVSTYFDTAKHKLKRQGLSLRIRQIGNKHIQTIKCANGGQFTRGEWESEIASSTPDLNKIDGTPLERLASKKLWRKLKPVFETSVHRVTIPVRAERSEIELAVDRGRLIAGRRSSPIQELELELKKGRLEDLFRLAKLVGRKAGAELYFRTKSDRGYELASGKGGQAVYAEPIELPGDLTAEEAFKTIARSAIRHFAGNADAVRNLEPEGIHQMRVGLRRLRAAISLFSHVVPGFRSEKINSELKWLTNELAPAREIDVFFKEKINKAARDIVPRRGVRATQREFAARRTKAFKRARKAVDSERCRALFIDVMGWIEEKHRGTGKDAVTPIENIAKNILHRRVKNALKHGRDLETLSAPDRHKFRIRIKKIRYATEFFESLFPGRRGRQKLARLSKHLKKIQDALGSLNDYISHQKMAADVALRAPAKNERARAFASGIILGREDEAVKPLMKAAIKEVHELRSGHWLTRPKCSKEGP